MKQEEHMNSKRFGQKYGPAGSWAFWNGDDVRDLTVIGRKWNKRKPYYVLVGLNLSRPVEYTWGNFHRSSYDAKLGYAISKTKYRGAYMTDIIKKKIKADSREVMKPLTPRKARKHVKKFKQEIKSLGCRNRVIIAFGGDVFEMLKKHMGSGYSIKEVMHYSYTYEKKYRKPHQYAQRLKADLARRAYKTSEAAR